MQSGRGEVLFKNMLRQITANYVIGKGVGRKIFRGGGWRGQWKDQDREIASTSHPPFYQWRVSERTEHLSRAHLKGILNQEPHLKREDLIFGKMLIFLENFRPFSCKKTLYPGPYLTLITLPLNFNQCSNELRRLVGVGMFSQKECLLKNTLSVS